MEFMRNREQRVGGRTRGLESSCPGWDRQPHSASGSAGACFQKDRHALHTLAHQASCLVAAASHFLLSDFIFCNFYIIYMYPLFMY